MTPSPIRAAIIPVTPLQQNCTLFWCTETMRGAFVDPGGDLPMLKKAAQQHGVTIEKLLITHGHIDHCGQAGVLARDLGVPVVPTAARANEGIPLLLQTISDIATSRVICKPRRTKSEPPSLKGALDKLETEVEKAFPNLPNPRWVALRLLEGDRRIVEAARTGELVSLAQETQLERQPALTPTSEAN